MGKTFKIEGLRETEAALADLGKSLGRGVLRRVGIRALTPMRDAARQMAPDDPSTEASIARTIEVTTRAPAGHKSAAQRAFGRVRFAGGSVADARAAARDAGGGTVEVHMGPNRNPKALFGEFGTGERFHKSGKSVGAAPAQPYMRPAWDAGKVPALEGIKDDLRAEIERTVARRARRAARRAAKDG